MRILKLSHFGMHVMFECTEIILCPPLEQTRLYLKNFLEVVRNTDVYEEVIEILLNIVVMLYLSNILLIYSWTSVILKSFVEKVSQSINADCMSSVDGRSYFHKLFT